MIRVCRVNSHCGHDSCWAVMARQSSIHWFRFDGWRGLADFTRTNSNAWRNGECGSYLNKINKIRFTE